MTGRSDGHRTFESLATFGLSCVLFEVLTFGAAFFCLAVVSVREEGAGGALLGSGVMPGVVGACIACWHWLRRAARTLPDPLLLPTFVIGLLALPSVGNIAWLLISGVAFQPPYAPF